MNRVSGGLTVTSGIGSRWPSWSPGLELHSGARIEPQGCAAWAAGTEHPQAASSSTEAERLTLQGSHQDKIELRAG